MLLEIGEQAALLVTLHTGERQDEVDEPPDADASEGQQLHDFGADLATLESVDAEDTQQPRKHPCWDE